MELSRGMDVSNSASEKRMIDTQALLAKMSPAQRAKVVEALKKDSRMNAILKRTGSIAWAAWDGWEKGVNGSLEGIWKGLQGAGEFLGESTAIAIHGKEGEFLQHAVDKTEWIRNGLDATGEFIGVSAAIIVEKSAWDTFSDTKSFWKGQVKKTKGLTAEQIANGVGNFAGSAAVGMVAGAGLNAASKASILGREIALGNNIMAKLADKSIVNMARVWAEYAGANMQSKDQGKKMMGLLGNFKGLKEKVALVERGIAQISSHGVPSKKMATELQKLLVRKELLTEKLGKLETNLLATGMQTAEMAALNKIEQRSVEKLRPRAPENQVVNKDAKRLANGTDGAPSPLPKKAASPKKAPVAEKAASNEIVANSRLTGSARVHAMEGALLTEKLLSDPSELKKLMKDKLIVLKDGGYHLTEKATKLIDDGHNAGKELFDQDFWSIRQKARASEGLPKSWKKELMDRGFMGKEAGSLDDLRKLDWRLANLLTSLSDPKRLFKFPTGSLWGDWAEEIISSTLNHLEKAKSRLSPELFESIKTQVHANIEKQLNDNISHRVNGQKKWLEDLKIGKCLEELSKKGFHLDTDILLKNPRNWNIKEELRELLSRARTSGDGLLSAERVLEIRKWAGAERKSFLTKLWSKDLTIEILEEIKITIKKQSEVIQSQLAGLKKLQEELALLKNTSAQEGDAKRKVAEAIKALEAEVSDIARFEKGSELATAGKRVEAKNAETLAQSAKNERNWAYSDMLHKNTTMNEAFKNMSDDHKIATLLGKMDFDLSPENAERFFELALKHKRFDSVRSKFTPEIMAKFGRDAKGNLTEESLRLGVQTYGTRALRRT